GLSLREECATFKGVWAPAIIAADARVASKDQSTSVSQDVGAGRGIRTLTGSPPPHFECGASAISPPRPMEQPQVYPPHPRATQSNTSGHHPAPCYPSSPIRSF